MSHINTVSTLNNKIRRPLRAIKKQSMVRNNNELKNKIFLTKLWLKIRMVTKRK